MDNVMRYAKGVVMIVGFVVGVLIEQFGVGIPLWATMLLTQITAVLVPNKQ